MWFLVALQIHLRSGLQASLALATLMKRYRHFLQESMSGGIRRLRTDSFIGVRSCKGLGGVVGNVRGFTPSLVLHGSPMRVLA